MRIVLDTNVVTSGFLWGGVPRQLLQAAHEKRLQLFTSTPLLLELTDILGRAKFARKLAAAQLSIDQVLACALAAKADIIVSGDRHLLDFKEYQGARIVTVAEAVRVISR